MMPLVEHERIDTLLALAITFAKAETSPNVVVKTGGDSSTPALTSPTVDFWHLLAPLAAHDREAVEKRAAWYQKLSIDKQAKWLTLALRRARPDAEPQQLDEHIHPSHIIEVLHDEPRRIQTILLRQLPPRLADACASQLQLKNVRPHSPEPRASLNRNEQDGREHRLSSRAEQPGSELVALVHRRFLRRFIDLNQLPNPTHLDTLSGAELTRLIRLSGVREAAIACRGVAQVENIASLWRRFPAEDARAFAAHMATLVDVKPVRVSFAEELVGQALGESTDPIAMLDYTGMLLLGLVVHTGDSKRLLYLAQKLPLNAARWLYEISDQVRQQHRRRGEIVQQISRETEALATNLRRASKRHDERSTYSSNQ